MSNKKAAAQHIEKQAIKPYISAMFTEMNERSRAVLRSIVTTYMETGEPVGSRSLVRRLGIELSPATIRNVMSDLEDMGLLYAPHVSAGRLPTDRGLRVFVDGMLEIGDLSDEERRAISTRCAATGKSMTEALEQASVVLSGLSACAGLVIAPKRSEPLKQIEFIHLSPGRALAVLVNENGMVENRIIELATDVPPSALTSASNYLNAHMAGRTLDQAKKEIAEEIRQKKTELDRLAENVVEAGLASWNQADGGHLFVRGQSHLLGDITAIAELERIRLLFEALETRETMLKLVESAGTAQGVQIFIGAENKLFEHSGCSMILAPCRNRNAEIVGAIGVIGPTRLNYGRIIPIVNYTSEVIEKLIG